MSVIVKGMKMPKACTKCSFFIGSDSPSFPFVECKFIGRLGSVFNFIDDVPCDCPLEELPPHGRLIDADALDYSMTDYAGNHLVYMVDIEEAPTIIPANNHETCYKEPV